MRENVQDKIKQEQKRYKEYLEGSNLKLSVGRQLVFDEVMQAHGHFAVEELVKQCQKHKTPVSRATIYRSIKELRESGIIRETAFGEKHQHFEHVYDEKLHHHARCIRCGVFIEFDDLGEEDKYTPLLEQQGFQILGHELHFYGFCLSCQDGKKKEKK